MNRFAFLVAKLLAGLIAVTFAAVYSSDMVSVEPAMLAGSAVAWFSVFGLIFKVEQEVESRLVIRTVRMG
jgi:hypothetical protein